MEDLVKERTAELRASQAELLRKERLATLGQLTATVSHELRNPLGAMRPSLYTIRKRIGAEDSRLTAALARVERGIDRCDHVIDELLDFTRGGSFHRKPIVIDEWLGEVLDEQSLPGGMTLRREFSLPGLTVSLDPDRCRRAFINVYENACQAMVLEDEPTRAKEGSVLTVGTRLAKARMEIMVADTGCGIPADVLPRIFEPLYSTRNFGVGLGLAIVKEILEQHGGGIEVETAEGQGTRVVLWVPWHDTEHPEPVASGE